MSGIEIAWLVLGAFPVIVAALEEYCQAFKRLQSWWRFQRTFEDFVHDVGMQQILFIRNLKKLLRPFMISEAQLDVLVDDPWGPAWQDHELRKNLRDRLADSYPYYESIVRRMNETLSELEEMLGIKRGKAVGLHSRKKFPEFELELKRLRISLSKRKFDLLDKLSRRNHDLERLLQTSDDLASLDEQYHTASDVSCLQRIQEQARHIHSGLDGAWHCNCKGAHCVNLLLEKKVHQQSMAEEPWRLLLPRNTLSAQAKWQEVKIQAISDDDSDGDPLGEAHRSPEIATNPISPPTVQNIVQQLDLKATRGTVPEPINRDNIAPTSSVRTSAEGRKSHKYIKTRQSLRSQFRQQKQSSFTRSAGSSEALTTSMPFATMTQSPKIERIHNMCATLASMDPTSACLGFLPGRHNTRHALYPTVERNLEVGYDTKSSLKEVFREHSKAKVIPRPQRYIIAATLASSLLQLHSTPWLKDGWTKNDIILQNHQSQAGNVPDLLLQEQFRSKRKSSILESSSSLPTRIDAKTALSKLGIMLLELYFGRPVEDYPLREAYFGPDAKPNAFTDTITAMKWLEDAAEDLQADMHDVIRRCLYCSFGPKPNFESQEFQKAVFHNVVLPLQNLLIVRLNG